MLFPVLCTDGFLPGLDLSISLHPPSPNPSLANTSSSPPSVLENQLPASPQVFLRDPDPFGFKTGGKKMELILIGSHEGAGGAQAKPSMGWTPMAGRRYPEFPQIVSMEAPAGGPGSGEE